MISIRSRVLLLVLSGGCCLAGCTPGEHGKFTNELREQSAQQTNRFRAATEWDIAQQHFQTGDLDSALEHTLNAARLDPENPLSRVLLTRIYIEKGEIASALSASQEGIEIQPALSDLWYYRAMAYERGRSLSLALECYKRAAELEPENPHYVLATAEMLIDLDRIQDARTYLLTRGEQVQYTPAFRATLGHITLMESDIDGAVQLIREASILAPDDDSIREDLARTLILAEQFSEAEPHIARLLDSRYGQNRRDLQVLHARCLLELRRPVDARRIALGLIANGGDRSDSDLWALVADVAITLQDNNLLYRAASRMIALEPSEEAGYLAMAMYHRRTGNMDRAYANAQAAVARSESGDSARQLLEVIRRDRE